MKGLSSLERSILECVGRQRLSFEEIKQQTGLHENVCFNILQALIIRGILATDGRVYRVSELLSPLALEELNGPEAKIAESLELVEAVVEQKESRIFRLQKIAMDERDEKIFLAMLSNLESFLADAHRKSQSSVPLKSRKVIFWGMGELQGLMGQMLRGAK
jgi:cyanate lyase